MTRETTPDQAAQQPELKRWPPQPETQPAAETSESKSFFAKKKADEEPQPTTGHERKIAAPHAKTADQALEPHEKPDQLHKADQSEDRQEALIDEGVEETFPASDPVSVKRIT